MFLQFRDLNRQYQHIQQSIDKGISSVINASSFISGKQVKELEDTLASYVGTKHCISCGNGTDAISIALMALLDGLPEDERKNCAVFVPDFTFFSSGECSAALGLPTYFVDVKHRTYNINTEALIESIERVNSEGKHIPKIVIAVDLFGQPAEYDELKKICNQYDLYLLEDGAQGFGGSITDIDGHKQKACSFGDIATTSFFPAKPFGCYGDGGAIFTDDDNLAMLCRSLAVHGKDMENPDDPMAKYCNVRLGMNSRLDTIQAAILLAKFSQFTSFELEAVNQVADWYTAHLSSVKDISLPEVLPGYYSSWAQYTITFGERMDREKIQIALKEQGIPTMIYYKKPMHKQGAFSGTVSEKSICPVTEELCERVLCLPIHPYLYESEVDMVCEKLMEFF